jgi:phage terminase large subunit
MELKITATPVFEKNWKAFQSEARYIINEGGSRSSKTYSILQCFILLALTNPNRTISIIRSTNVNVVKGPVKDLVDILRDLGIYNEKSYYSKDGYYKFSNGSIIEWFGCDDASKLRGRKRDYAWLNEAQEIDYDIYYQIAIRTTKKIVFDYNPSAPDSYLYQIPDEKCIRIHSTYKDNPFVAESFIEQVEETRDSDPDYYTIFALGKRCFSSENVFREWPQVPKPDHLHDYIYAIDFGHVHATAMVKIWFSRTTREVWVEEVIYEKGLTSTDILKIMELKGVEKHVPIIAETARPEILTDFRRAGYTVHLADKNVQDGLLTMKSFKIQISPEATNLKKENFNYRYKKVNGKQSEEPVKLWDDLIDALRYGMMYIKKFVVNNGTPRRVRTFNF